MRGIVVLLLLAALAGLQGCVAGTGTMTGGALGGLASAGVAALLPDSTKPWVRTVATAAPAVIGFGGGYLYDSSQAKKKAKEEQRLQQQQQMQQVAQNTRLTVPVAIVAANNQGIRVQNGQGLAPYLMNVQPGMTIKLLVKRSNQDILVQDMYQNGFELFGEPQPAGANAILTFRRAPMQSTPMSLQQIAL